MKKKCSFSWGKINLGRRDFAEKFLNAPRWIFLHLFVVLQEPSNGPFVLCVRKEQALEIACFNAQSVSEPSSQQLCANIFFKIPCGKSPSSPNAQAMKKWGLCHQRPPLGAHLQRHSVKELLQHSFQRENQSVKKMTFMCCARNDHWADSSHQDWGFIPPKRWCQGKQPLLSVVQTSSQTQGHVVSAWFQGVPGSISAQPQNPSTKAHRGLNPLGLFSQLREQACCSQLQIPQIQHHQLQHLRTMNSFPLHLNQHSPWRWVSWDRTSWSKSKCASH